MRDLAARYMNEWDRSEGARGRAWLRLWYAAGAYCRVAIPYLGSDLGSHIDRAFWRGAMREASTFGAGWAWPGWGNRAHRKAKRRGQCSTP